MLKVTIVGEVATGKTSVALAIQDALDFHGIPTNVVDRDLDDITMSPEQLALNGRRLCAVAKRMREKGEVVKIETVQIRKDSGLAMTMTFSSLEEYEKLLNALRVGENALRNVQSMSSHFENAADVIEKHIISMDAGRDPG